MQARSLAMSVGASDQEIHEVVNELLKTAINQENAKKILENLRQSK